MTLMSIMSETNVPRGAINRSATAPIQRSGDCLNAAPRGTKAGGTIAEKPQQNQIEELQAFANEVLAICGPWLLGRLPEGFVGPPVSGPAKLTRLA